MAFRASTRAGTPADFLIVGLGNPGADFEHTRHNVGADCVALLARRCGSVLKRESREKALACTVKIAGRRVVLAYPQTFMNLSGESVRPLVARHGIVDPASIVVVHDELDLPVARLKLKLGGGLAGNNGLKSIKAHLDTAEFARIRIGIGRPPGTQQGADYVLRKPGKAERELLNVALEQAADAIELIVTDGLERAMNTYNTLP